MAKSLLQVRTKKKPKSTKSETYVINRKYMGDEPMFKGNVLRVDLLRAFTWYNTMVEEDEEREFIYDYLKSVKQDKLIKVVRNIPYAFLPHTSAWVFRMHMRGANLEGDMVERAFKRLMESFQHSRQQKQESALVDRPNIQDRVRERVSEIIGDVEALLDSGNIFSMYEWLQKNEIPAAHAKKIADYYRPLKDEYYEAAMGINKEGYEKYTSSQLKAKLAQVHSLIEDCERFSGNVKKARAPRKKKAPTTEKILKHFVYQKESNEFKLQSIDPSSIIGSNELWVFNTKNKLLTVFRARGPAGLNISRTSVNGCDNDLSISKRIGRNTEKILKDVLGGGKISLRKLMESINTEPTKFSERINKDTILLRVVR